MLDITVSDVADVELRATVEKVCNFVCGFNFFSSEKKLNFCFCDIVRQRKTSISQKDIKINYSY